MLEIVLICPGCTDYDLQGRIQGNLDVPLNEQGIDEVKRTIEEVRGLGIEVVYAPDCEPAMEAGHLIADALDVKLKKLDHMRNLNHGLWQGMLVEEVRLKQPKVYRQWQEHPENVCPPEGEMLFSAVQRVEAAMTKLLKRHKAGVVAVVLREPMATLVRRFVTHDEIGDLWKAIEEHGRWQLLAVNPAMAHTTG
jgi:broad specificity phosphatase PhoE